MSAGEWRNLISRYTFLKEDNIVTQNCHNCASCISNETKYIKQRPKFSRTDILYQRTSFISQISFCCCCCLPCYHCSNWAWVVGRKFWHMVKGCVLRTAGSSSIKTIQTRLLR